MELITEGRYQYYESLGGDETLLLLHGLMGSLSNFTGIIEKFSKTYNVVLPIMPIFDLPLKQTGLGGLLDYVEGFVEMKGYSGINVLGNSLGGHLSQLVVFRNPDKYKTLCLTGSSGLFEDSMGNTFPRRGDYSYIEEKTRLTFYDPDSVVTKEMVDEIYELVNNKNKAIRLVITAKTAIRHNVEDRLETIKIPTLLIWGKDDTITPPFVAEKFNSKIKGSELHFIPQCGHAPMMERPDEFNAILDQFLSKHSNKTS